VFNKIRKEQKIPSRRKDEGLLCRRLRTNRKEPGTKRAARGDWERPLENVGQRKARSSWEVDGVVRGGRSFLLGADDSTGRGEEKYRVRRHNLQKNGRRGEKNQRQKKEITKTD